MMREVLGKLCLAAVVGLLGCVGAGAQGHAARDAKTAPVLMLSDLHFDPFHDPAQGAKLVDAPIEQWDAILKSAPSEHQAESFAAIQTACHARGVDTDFALLGASLHAAQEHARDLAFVTVTGDLLVHGFDCRYKFVTHSDVGYAEFAERTARYVMHSVEAAFPAVPVYIALGNNDSSCGDYRMDQHDRFLQATSDLVIAGLRGASAPEAKAARADYEAGGYFSVSLKTPRRTRLLALDDIFLSEKYATCAGKPETAGANAELAWLDHQLTEAKQHGESVWVIGHIPPGLDIYSTLRAMKDVCTGAKVKTYLGSDRLVELLVEHADIVRLGLFAHTHSDEMRLLDERVPVKLVSSISPVNGNRPTFTIARVDAASAAMSDYTVFEASNATGIETSWSPEYSFRETYHEPDFSGRSIADLTRQFQADPEGAKPASHAYETYFAPGMVPILELVWSQYACALDHTTAEGYKACSCSAK